MKNTAMKSGQNGNQQHEKVDAAKGLRGLFVEELKRIYWAEKALVTAIPKMIKNAAAPELAEALTGHLEVTEKHVTRLEEVFSSIGEKAEAIKCDLMEGLINVAGKIMEHTEAGVVRDAGIILAAEKVEHHEMASYGTLSAFAKTLGEEEAAGLLEETLDEEKEASEKLSELAKSAITVEADDEDKDDEHEKDGAMAHAKEKRR